uniref:Uncharacterized protein n=1 Tax=Megaviridae environmental sample TaxID=1737588 RepID=A0A5J6VKK8_9VIRU|nr:MAG: hypothetical protein [Megaviridae environmental sample]
MSYRTLQCIIVTTTFLSTIAGGGLLIKDHEEIKNNFLNYTSIEKTQLVNVVYIELFYLFSILYYVLKIIWTGIVFCWTNNYDDRPRFNLLSVVLMILCAGSNSYILYYLFTTHEIINKNLTIASSILSGNFLFAIFIGIVNKILIVCCKSEKYNTVNNSYA